jgi:hypothetical protein
VRIAQQKRGIGPARNEDIGRWNRIVPQHLQKPLTSGGN